MEASSHKEETIENNTKVKGQLLQASASVRKISGQSRGTEKHDEGTKLTVQAKEDELLSTATQSSARGGFSGASEDEIKRKLGQVHCDNTVDETDYSVHVDPIDRERVAWYNCPLCGRSFTNHKALNKHLRIYH